MEMNQFKIINFFNNSSENDLIKYLESNDFEIFVIDGKKINGENSFFELLTLALPVNGSKIENGNWDQILDRYWQHIHLSSKKHFAVVLKDTQYLLEGELQMLISFVNIMSSFAKNLHQYCIKEKLEKVSYVFLLGSGVNFQ